MTQIILLTPKGLEKIKSERDKLQGRRKPAVENLRTAREMGDLSENGAYRAARWELSSIDSRLRHLNKLIILGKIPDMPKSGEIGIGSKVALILDDKKIEYEIVGSFESDPFAGKISHISPIGKMLIGKKAGDRVEVFAPNGTVTYQVVSVK